MELSPVAKRRVLVDALMVGFERSEICEQIQPDTLRSLIDSAMSELWRGGQVQLAPVWKMLTSQPELNPQDIAPPLLLYKQHQHLLDVDVVLPPQLDALPDDERAQLRQQLPLADVDYMRAVDGLWTKAKAAPAPEAVKRPVAAEPLAEEAAVSEFPHADNPVKARRRKLITASVLSVMAVIGLGFAFRPGAFTLGDTFDVSDVKQLLVLQHAVLNVGTLQADVVDPRWDQLTKDARQKLTLAIFEIELKKGVTTLRLTRPGDQKLLAVANDWGSGQHYATVYE